MEDLGNKKKFGFFKVYIKHTENLFGIFDFLNTQNKNKNIYNKLNHIYTNFL
jgi:hypothetical protein